MSLFGLVTVVNIIALSQLGCIATGESILDTVVDEVNKLILNFTRDGMKPLVYQTLFSEPLTLGWVGLMDVKSKCG